MSILVTPSTQYRDSFLAGAEEFLAEDRLESTYGVHLGYDMQGLKRHFDLFVRDLIALGEPAWNARGDYVDRVYWLIDGGQYLGQSSIRPELSNEYLITYGGHIGYSIRPSRRCCGYGKELLTLTLEVCRILRLRKVLVTCDSDNIGSRRIIEANNGVFESAMAMNSSTFRAEGRSANREVKKLRYWIEPGQGNSRTR